MTAITSYATLKQNIEDYHKRGNSSSKYDQFIDSCEQDIWNQLRVVEMEDRATASTSTTDRFLALPDGFLKMRQLQITIDTELYDMDFVPLKSMTIYSQAGVPTQFTVTDQIEFNRTADQAYTMEMNYWRKLTALSSSNTTNDILDNYPNIYLFGCLHYAFLWSMQYDLAQMWEAKFNEQVAEANRRSRKNHIGPTPHTFISGGMIV